MSCNEETTGKIYHAFNYNVRFLCNQSPYVGVNGLLNFNSADTGTQPNSVEICLQDEDI